MEAFQFLMDGFAICFQWQYLLITILGCLVGTLIGVLPGVGPAAGTAMLLPLTFGMSPIASIIMLSAIYYGAMYGGTITSGVVAVEMLTGKRLFEGETVSDTIASVLTKPDEVEALPYASLWERCLERDPKRRLRDIGEARIALEQKPAERREASKPSRLPWIVAAVAAMLAVVGFVWRPSPTLAPANPIRANLELPSVLTLLTYDRSVALSPDGTTVALAAYDPGKKTWILFLRDLARLELRPLSGTDGATYPFWSPDGKNLGFFADGKPKRIGLADGIARTLCDAAQGRGGTCSPHGTIVFAPGAFGILHQVSDGGGTSGN